MTARLPLVNNSGALSEIPSTDQIRVPVGSVTLPGLVFTGDTTTGIYSSASGSLSLASIGIEGLRFGALGIALGAGFDPASSIDIRHTGSDNTNITASSETGACNLNFSRYIATNGGAASGLFQKARGTTASPATIVTLDNLGSFGWRGYGTTGFQGSAFIAVQGIDTTPSDTAMGGRLKFNVAPIGDVALATTMEMGRLEQATGFSMYGANPVIDQNRVFRPRSYTVATVPTVTATGLISLSDEGGASAQARADGTNWRRTDDGQVVSATIGSRGVLASLSARADENLMTLIKGVFYRLDKYSITAKLKGLWVHAMPNQTDALLNWITPGTRNMTITGSPTFTANQGFTGDGTTALLNTTGTEAQFGGSQNDLTVGAYVLVASGSSAAIIGKAAGTRHIYLTSASSSTLTARINDTTNDTFTPARYTGMFTLSRTGSTNYKAYLDDAVSATITRNSVAISANAITFLGATDATGSEFSTAKLAFSFVGVGMTDADVAHLRAIMVDYFLVGVGAVSPTVANLPPAADFQNNTLYFSDLGGQAGSLRSNGTNWQRADTPGYETQGDADKTLVSLTNGVYQAFNTLLTANRTVTLSGTNAYKGAMFHCTRNGLGVFTLAFVDGPSSANLITFPVSVAKSAIFIFDGTNWKLMQDSTI